MIRTKKIMINKLNNTIGEKEEEEEAETIVEWKCPWEYHSYICFCVGRFQRDGLLLLN